jgi:hypothetical protein
MEFKLGERIKYFFPNPKSSSKPFFIGLIENVADNHIKNDENITLKVSFANFDLLKRIKSSSDTNSILSENYYG